ncbi:MAG: glycosyltransferase family 2 protein [Prevotella sp.]|nr:glycosyltransferase family 2 protein [Prevotella sp.]
MKTFTIVIPAYNQLSLLRRALESVLRQEGTDYDIIISDDSSDDKIERYVQQLGNRDIHYVRHQQGKRAAYNWNDGLQMATGQYLILMHHDEEMAGSDYLKCVQQQMEQGADITISTVCVNGQKKRQHGNRWLKEYVCNHPALLFLLNVIGPCACLTFRRELLQTFNTDLIWLVDVEWYYRMLNGRKPVCIHTLTIHSHHGHESQISQTINMKEAFLSDKVILSHVYQQDKTVRRILFLYQYGILNIKQLFGKG